MRNYDTPVRAIRHKVFAEVAKAGFESSDETLIHDIEAIPYNIVEEKAKYRESIYRERAVASERVRLAMGLSLRPENKAVHLTDGLAASNINEKYYEPPLMQVIPSACAACPPNKYIVSNMCRGCVAHPCMQACPKGASNAANARQSVHTMPSHTTYVHASRHVESKRLEVMSRAVQAFWKTNVYHVVCVW